MCEMSGFKTLSESELADARQVLDGTAREHARLQIEIGKVQAELEETRKSAKKREGKLTVAQGRVKDLEFLFHISDAELTVALGDKHGWRQEVAELRAQLTKVGWSRCGQGAVGEGDADTQTWRTAARACRRSWLSARVCLRRRCENPTEASATLGGGGQQPAQEYDFKMAQALEDLHSQHEEQVHLYQLELEQPYQAKLDNAKPSSKQNDKAASAAPEELKEAHMLLESLSYQLSGLQKQASAAEDHVRELEEALAGERDKFCKMLDTKEQEVTDVHDAMQQQLAEYQELLESSWPWT